MKNLIKKLGVLGFSLLATIQTFAFNFNDSYIKPDDLQPDSSTLNLFKGMFRFGATMVFVVQVLVTIIMVVIIVWQVMNFVTGQQVDLGKVIMYVIGAVAVVVLVWISPNLLTKKNTNKTGESTGAIIRIEKIEKPDILEKLSVE